MDAFRVETREHVADLFVGGRGLTAFERIQERAKRLVDVLAPLRVVA
jgi:SHS2 domain-containing protein